MRIIDCTTYYSEDLMLDVRFNILNEHVDKFIITESKFSHSGKEKKLNFDVNNFPKFKDKIQYLVIENEPSGIDKDNVSSSVKRMNSLLRINQSYDFMMNAVKNASDNDLICLSDNDEIPNFESRDFKENNLIECLEDDHRMTQAMVKYPKIIERPIFIVGEKAVIARPPEKIFEILR